MQMADYDKIIALPRGAQTPPDNFPIHLPVIGEMSMTRLVDLTGKRYGRWVVISTTSEKGRQYAKCVCDCGTIRTVEKFTLSSGKSKSCGCLKAEETRKRFTKHGAQSGYVRTREYTVWLGLKQRCYNEKEISYPNYGARGIKVCDRWLNSFENFLGDMGLCPEGFSIERMDYNGDYCPENCKWATRSEQANNTRANRVISYNGEKKNLGQWAKEYGIDSLVLFKRLKRGWSIERALTIKSNPQLRMISFNGEERTLADWARVLGIPVTTIQSRLRRGWSVSDALAKDSGDGSV